VGEAADAPRQHRKSRSEIKIKKPALTPTLSPEERENGLPRPDDVEMLDLQWRMIVK
jgi:hypothetical protein